MTREVLMNATDKSPLGTFLWTMLSTHAHKMGLRVDLQEDKIGRVHFVRHDVTGSRSGEDWFCFSLVLVSSDHSVGIWTRDMMAKSIPPYSRGSKSLALRFGTGIRFAFRCSISRA